MKKDVSEIYKTLSDIDHTLLRPASFLGSVVSEKSNQYILEEGKFVLKDVIYNPGFHKLFDEIISNSVDESKRPGTSLNTIKVEIDKEKGTISVFDNGGIPVEIHKDTKMYVPQMIFGNLRSSSNYNDEEDRSWVGVNGLGSKISNIFSTSFKVETADGKKKFEMEWTENMKKHSKEKVSSTSKHYTRITYTPELSRFGMKEISDDDIRIMEKRVYEIAGCNPKLTIFFQGKKILINSFKDYCNMYLDENNPLIYIENKDWQVGVALSNSGNFQQVSYVNSVYTYDGGSHINYIIDQITPYLREKITKKYKRYLKTIFRFQDPEYQKQFERLLGSDAQFANGPYLDVTDSFKKGDSIEMLISKGKLPAGFSKLDINQTRPLYLHQQISTEKALSGKNVVVSTGTGSGKTESFLILLQTPKPEPQAIQKLHLFRAQ